MTHKTRSIPDNAELREYPAAAVIAYCYQGQNGPVLKAFKGRQTNPAIYLWFANIERRDEHLRDYIESETRLEAEKRARREIGHGLFVGDIVYSSWGYEQTNVEFYQVIRVPSSRSAVVRELEQTVNGNGALSMSGTTTPKPNQFTPGSKDNLHRNCGLHTLSGGKSFRSYLYKWDGKPMRFSSYA